MKKYLIAFGLMVAAQSAYAKNEIAIRKATVWDEKLIAIANKEGVPALLLAGVCFVESSHQPHATNFDDGGSSSIGLCQIKLTTAQQVGYTGTVQGLYDGKTNAKYAARYLKWQLNRYDQDWKKAIAAYNAGSVPRDGIIRNMGYVNKVMKAIRQ